MTLAEKLAALRGERRLSQGDLAEELDVSRQSVSKWETGQAVPELDKIIKLADLFGVSVDELVRDGETPQPPEPQVIYVERGQEQKAGRTPAQILGIICAATGGGMILFALLDAAVFLLPGIGLVLLSLPLLLAKRHPWLIVGWSLAGVGWWICPYMGLTPFKPLGGFQWIYHYFTAPELSAGRRAILLGGTIAAARDILTLVLIVLTARLCWKQWKARKTEDTQTAS